MFDGIEFRGGVGQNRGVHVIQLVIMASGWWELVDECLRSTVWFRGIKLSAVMLCFDFGFYSGHTHACEK